MLSLGACQQSEGVQPLESELSSQRDGEPTILGKQLENPYSVENMKRALANFKKPK